MQSLLNSDLPMGTPQLFARLCILCLRTIRAIDSVQTYSLARPALFFCNVQSNIQICLTKITYAYLRRVRRTVNVQRAHIRYRAGPQKRRPRPQVHETATLDAIPSTPCPSVHALAGSLYSVGAAKFDPQIRSHQVPGGFRSHNWNYYWLVTARLIRV